MMDTMENSQFCVSVHCVLGHNVTEATCPRDLFQAYECCKENGFNVTWVDEADALKMNPQKEDVFIMSEFSGNLFSYLQQFKCTIIGPQCLLVCIQKNMPLPDCPHPVFTIAMSGLVVTTTGCTPNEKKEIQEKVQFMGGKYNSAFHGNVTHLIVKSVADFSQKFKVAIQRDVPIMTPSWVDAVWTASHKEAVHGTDPTFARYACPPFQGLVVCVSQIGSKEREALKKIIEANGGQYSGQLEMNKTNVLIVTSAEGEKYSYARKWKIRCLRPDWIHQSLSKGYAVDPEPFTVERGELSAAPRCSTPEADHSVRGPRFGDGSINSTIMNESNIHHVNETASTTNMTTLQALQPQPTDRWAEAVDSIDLALSKKAGPFLDGCKIFFSGFSDVHAEKLRRVLNNAGVARFNTISESLSHLIAGQRIDDHWKQLDQLAHKPHVVTAEWIVQSLRLKRAAPEAAYLHPDFVPLVSGSDLKKASNDSTTKMKPPPAPAAEEREEETQMMQQYLSSSGLQDAEEAPTGVFAGLKFQLAGMDAETASDFGDLIMTQGGKVVTERSQYLVLDPSSEYVPTPKDLQGEAIVVNTLWLEDCVDQECLVEFEIYHRHVMVVDPKRLAGCVISFSGIQPGRFKEFLVHLIRHMGGQLQETFSRKSVEERRVVKSTHLATSQPEGKKYEKALEWGVPAVDPQWIVACATCRARPNEADYPPGQGQPVAPSEATAAETPKHPAQSVVLPSSRQKQKLLDTPLAETSVTDSTPRPAALDLLGNQTPGTPLATATVTPHLRAALARRLAAQQSPATPLATPGTSPFSGSGLFNNIQTPETPYGRLLNPDPSPATRKMWKMALDNRVKFTPRPDDDGEESGRDNSGQRRPNEENGGPASGSGNGEIVIDPDAEAYFQNLAKKFRPDDGTRPVLTPKLENEPAKTSSTSSRPPFDGVVVFINKKIENHSELIRAVEKLGGKLRYQHCEEVTHYVFQGKLPATKEVKNAKEWHQKFVAPAWILDSEDASARLEESQYPPSLNPKMALGSLSFSSQPTPGPPPSQSQTQSSQKRRRPAAMPAEEECGGLSTPKTTRPPSIPDETPEQLEEETCQQLLQLEQVMSRSTEQQPADPTPVRIKVAPKPSTGFIPPTQPVPAEAPDSQSVPIGWDLHETSSVGAPSGPSQSIYRVMLSGMDQEERDECSVIIEQLGGTVLSGSHYDPTSTHIATPKAGFNEKMLTSVAAGKWVLHVDWVIESGKAGRFLHEPDYEWGNPAAVVRFHELGLLESKEDADVARAAYYWRTSRSTGRSGGPFSGITAVLYLRDKNDSFKRLLEAGGGHVVDAETALRNSKVNLCIADQRELKRLDLTAFASRGIYVVNLFYLRKVVLAAGSQTPTWTESVVPEFRPHLDKLPPASMGK